MNYNSAPVIEPQRSYSILSDEYYLASLKFQTPTSQMFIWNYYLIIARMFDPGEWNIWYAMGI